MLKLVLIGPPGSGKGTQATRLVEASGARHISTGDLLRSEVAAGTELGRTVHRFQIAGELVPDGVILDLTVPLVEQAGHENGYVLDGFPRSLGQAEQLEVALSDEASITKVVLMTVTESELLSRMQARAQTEQRADDTPEIFRRRLAVYDAETAPLSDFYRDRGLLIEVAADGDPDTVSSRLRTLLEL